MHRGVRLKVTKNGESSYALTDWYIENLQGRTFWVFDLECTGGNVEAARVMQFGAVRVERGRPVPGSEFTRLVNPGQPIRPFIAELTGITDERVKDAASFPEVFAEFTQRGAGCVWAAHSAFEFDLPMLLAECRRHGLPFPDVPVMDNRALHTYLYPDRAGVFGTAYQLAHFGIEVGTRQRHDALGDALLAADIFCANLKLCRERGVHHIQVGDEALTVQYGHLPEAAPTLEWTLPIPISRSGN